MQLSHASPNQAPDAPRVLAQDRIDRQLARHTALAFDASGFEPGATVLDVGCGAGRTTLEIARRVAPGGRAVGVDISMDALDIARHRLGAERLDNVEFLQADAQCAALPPRSFDRVFSRFGVMFFGEPEEAFRNLARALRPSGRMVFLAWCAPEANPWMSLPARIVRQLVPDAPQPGAEECGMFSLADPQATAAILSRAGFHEIELRRCEIPFGRTPRDATATQLLQSPSIADVLSRGTQEIRRRAHDALVRELQAYECAEGVLLPSAAWIVRARPGASVAQE